MAETFTETIEVQTHERDQILDVTAEVRRIARAMGTEDGLVVCYVPHTTAGITVNEGADPDVKADVLMALRHIVSDRLPYRHAEGNSPAHVKSVLTGSSVTLILRAGRLELGTWGSIYFCEFDGPRHRRLMVKVMAG